MNLKEINSWQNAYKVVCFDSGICKIYVPFYCGISWDLLVNFN